MVTADLLKERLDKSLPQALKETQEWFAQVITTPLIPQNSSEDVERSGMILAEEASRYIVPTRAMSPKERIQIYNQQYWWRLLNTLHENFPFLTRLFGYQAFNEEIAIPFLLKYPPDHWSLNVLGEKLPQWIMDSYRAPDQPFIYNVAKLDWAFMASFIAFQKQGLTPEALCGDKVDVLLTQIFYLQPHIQLFKWDYDLLSFREIFLRESVEYWTENPFPPLPKERSFIYILYRSHKNNLIWKEISLGEYLLLSEFQKGTTIDALCQKIEKEYSSIYEETISKLQEWLQEWTVRHWLSLEPTEKN